MAAKNKYDVILEKVGNQPLMTTKILCEALGLGLAKAKGMVDKAPYTVAKELDSANALYLKNKLEAIGNTVFIPGLKIEDEPSASTISNNTTVSVDEAFDAIFGNGAAQKASKKKNDVAATNDAFDKLFGK